MSFANQTCSCGVHLGVEMWMLDELWAARHLEMGCELGLRDLLHALADRQCCRLHLTSFARNAHAFADTAAAERGARLPVAAAGPPPQQ